jgi:uncharacterized repeat protein (TIGR01451 family)
MSCANAGAAIIAVREEPKESGDDSPHSKGPSCRRGDAGVNAVLFVLMLGAWLSGQVPPPPPDVLPPTAPVEVPCPPSPVQLPGPKAPLLAKPPALVPVNPDLGGPAPLPDSVALPPSTRPDGSKPLPFKLIDPQPLVGPSSLKPAPAAVSIDPLPPDSVVTPCLLLQRSGPTSVKANQPFTYEMVVRNVGSLPAAQAKLEETLPPGTTFLGAQPMPITQGDQLAWLLEQMAPGAERRIKVEVQALADGEWKARANLTVTVASVMPIRVTGAPPSLLSMTGPASVPVGHPVALPMRVTNSTGAPLTDVVLHVQLSAGLQHLCGNAIEGSLGDLGPGQSKEIPLDAIAVQTGRLTVDATLLSGKKALATAKAAVIATEPSTLALRQTGPLSPAVGSEHDFRLEITNRSDSELRDVQISDVLPQGLQYVASDGSASYDPGTRSIRWTIASLPPGQARQLVFRAAVSETGPQVNRVSARTATGYGTQLYTILRPGGKS